MPSDPRLRASRFVVAAAVSTLLVLSAPFIGYVRAWIRTQFPGQFVRIVGGLLAVMAIVAIGTALARIRERRALRYAAIASALACAVWYSLATATGVPDVDVVERFHFVEYGLITFLFYRAWRPVNDPSIVVLTVLAALLVGTADEWLQWFIPNRVGEMADVFLNGIAIACGLVFSLGADPPSEFRWRVPPQRAQNAGPKPGVPAARLVRGGVEPGVEPGSLARIGRFAAALIIAFALFFHIVHLGYDVVDDEAGGFKSRYSKAGLESMVVQKLAEWRAHPLPLVLQRVSREDQYMTEGVTHVQERNELWAAGDATGAWKENRILEKYYAPVLDTPSYVSRTGHRWSAEQRTAVQAQVPTGASPPYASAAKPYPIYTWPRRVVWAIAIALAAALVIATSWIDRNARLPPAS